MPIALDTAETFEVVLTTDQGKPSPPAFVFRYLTSREFRRVAAVGDDREHMETSSAPETLDKLFDALRVNLAGWRNLTDRAGQAIPYNPDHLEDLLTVVEAWQLYYQARRQARLEDREKKAFASPSPGSTDASAPAGAAIVPTPPASDSPQTSSAPAATARAATPVKGSASSA